VGDEPRFRQMSDAPLQTEFEFTLPQGYVDDDGTVHKDGRMRLATAADEIQPLNDPRVQENSSYLTVLLLSRVVTELGTVEEVTPEVIESLFVTDLAYLQEMYDRVNDGSTDFAEVTDHEELLSGVDAESGNPQVR
jgi:hypothetical protein